MYKSSLVEARLPYKTSASTSATLRGNVVQSDATCEGRKAAGMFPKVELLVVCLFVKAYGQHHQTTAGYPVPAYSGYAPPVGAIDNQGYSGYAPPPPPNAYGFDMVDGYGHGQFRGEHGDYKNVRSGSYGHHDAYSLYGRMNYGISDNRFRSAVAANQQGTVPAATAPVAYNAGQVVPAVTAGARPLKPELGVTGYGSRGVATNYDSAYRRHNEYGNRPHGGDGAGIGEVLYGGYGYAPNDANFGGQRFGVPFPYGYGAASYAGGQYHPFAYGGDGGFAAGIQGYRRR